MSSKGEVVRDKTWYKEKRKMRNKGITDIYHPYIMSAKGEVVRERGIMSRRARRRASKRSKRVRNIFESPDEMFSQSDSVKGQPTKRMPDNKRIKDTMYSSVIFLLRLMKARNVKTEQELASLLVSSSLTDDERERLLRIYWKKTFSKQAQKALEIVEKFCDAARICPAEPIPPKQQLIE